MKIIIAAVFLLVIIAIMIVSIVNRNLERFENPYLSLVHIEPERVPMALDAYRGPSDLNGILDASAALSDLSKNHGLFIYEDGNEFQGLCVSDAAVMANSADSGFKLPLLVAPLSTYPQTKRSLFLLAPLDPESDPPSLGQIIKSGRKIHVLCTSTLESSLFEVAWAIAGGGDVSSSDSVTVRIIGRGPSATAQAALQSDAFVIVPVWSCPGSRAHKVIFAAWPKQHVACVSYHPADEDTMDGFLVENAPHMIKARAPALTASPVSVIRGFRPPRSKSRPTGSYTQRVLTAPSLVVLYPTSNDDPDPVLLMADAMSDAFLKNTKSDPETTIALCTFYEAQGIPLLPRTEETVRAFERKRQSVVMQSPYSRPRVPIMEQFDDGNNIELVPKYPVSLTVESKLGYDDAKLAPRQGPGSGSVSVDGVRLRLGDRVILEMQESPAENGSWTVVKTVGPQGIPVLQKPVALDPDRYRTKLERSSSISPLIERGWQWRFTLQDPNTFMREGDRVAWLPLPGAPTGTVSAVVGQRIEIVVPDGLVVASPEASSLEGEWFDPLSRCLDADAVGYTLDTRQQCEIKQKDGAPYSWDRPCISETDCPYLQNGTDRRRGRCLKSGRCEEPVGVKPFAYRKIADDIGLVCECPKNDDYPAITLRAASGACCDRPGATPVFSLQ